MSSISPVGSSPPPAPVARPPADNDSAPAKRPDHDGDADDAKPVAAAKAPGTGTVVDIKA